MSMRALVLLMGLILIGNAEARAVNAPLTADSRTVDPREDLFASKPKSAAPVATPASTPALAPPPATSNAEHVLSGNPLWAIPLGRLTASREHPLFAPTRRPPPVAAVAAPAAAPVAPPPKPVEPEKPQLSLIGTIAGTRAAVGVGLFMDSASKAVLRLKAGENHKGWTLRAVRPRQVELANGLDSAVLDLPPPDIRAGAAAPMLAAPSAMPAAPSPVNLVTPPTVHPGANMNLPVNRAGGPQPGTLVAPGVQPPTFKPPPPQINPFENTWQR